jgi:hypothetical protein
VVIVESCYELNLFTQALFKLKHGVDSDLGEVEVFVAVFALRVWTYDKTVKDSALWGLIYHVVGLLAG